MNHRQGQRGFWLAGILFALWTLHVSVASAQSYRVELDTTVLAGTTGFLDFQLNPADLSAPSALATLTGLGGNLSLFGTPELAGDVSGAFPGPITLTNSTAFNDSFQSVAFGTTASFMVTFSGDFATQPSGSATSFAFSLYAADGVTPLLTNDVSGSLLRFELASSGVSFQSFGPGSPLVTSVAPVPLPAAGWLLLSGLVGLVRVSRADQHRQGRSKS